MKYFTAILIFILLFKGIAFCQDAEAITDRRFINQNVETSPNIYEILMKPKALRKIQTALDYFTVIDLPEKALNVYIGNQELFKVEVYERQVLIKPLIEDMTAETNLLVITESGRFVFQITVGPPETAEFVIDARLGDEIIEDKVEKALEEKEAELENSLEKKEQELESRAEKIADEKVKEKLLEESKQIRLKSSRSNGDIQANLLSISKIGKRIYLKFSVLNYSKTSYKVLETLIGFEETKRNWLKQEKSGFVKIESESSLPSVIEPSQYVYGMLSFDGRALKKEEKPVFKLLESEGNRNIEIRGFPWIERKDGRI